MAYETQLLDETNRRIIEELQTEARLTMAELGRRVNLSPPAVAERVQRLERAGVITGYHAGIDPKAIGYPLAAVVRVRPASRQLHKIPEVAREVPEVVECYRITGEDCFFVKLHVRDVVHLEEVIDAFAFSGPPPPSIMQTSPVPRRAVSAPRM